MQNGRLGHFSHPVFSSYIIDAQVPMKQFVANMLGRLMPLPLVKAELPSFARANVTAQPGRRMLWLMSYIPERRGNSIDMIDPRLVAPERGDYHLAVGSPCLSAAMDVGLTRDFDGTPVPQGAAPDIGALESR